MNKSIGLLEVQGYSVALFAMDQACKAADIAIEGIDCNNPILGNDAAIPVVVQVKFSGSIADVKTALEAASQAASQYIDEEDIITQMIPLASDDLKKLLPLGKVKRKS